MGCRGLAFVFLGVAVFVLSCNRLERATGGAEGNKLIGRFPAEMLSPKEGAAVNRVEEMKGRLISGGWPVVLVQPAREPWYVQPRVGEPGPDGQFSAQVHFGNEQTPSGTEFRLVIIVARTKEQAEGFAPGAVLGELPGDLPRSEFVTVTRKGEDQSGTPSSQKLSAIRFSDQPWQIKTGMLVGPGPNNFTRETVWLDERGHLHLAVIRRDECWECAEVIGPELGYGEYRWTISGDLISLDPQVVLGLFLYKDDAHEIDFELARWGDAARANAQFVVQPHGDDTIHRFDTGEAKVLTCSLVWQPGNVWWRCWANTDTNQQPLADWKHTGQRVPEPDGVRTRMNFWLRGGRPPSGGESQEIVVRAFHYSRGASTTEMGPGR